MSWNQGGVAPCTQHQNIHSSLSGVAPAQQHCNIYTDKQTVVTSVVKHCTAGQSTPAAPATSMISDLVFSKSSQTEKNTWHVLFM